MWYQKNSRSNFIESALKMVLIFFYFQDYSKSARGMISFLLDLCFFTPILHKTAEKPTVMWIFTQNCFESRVCRFSCCSCWFFFITTIFSKDLTNLYLRFPYLLSMIGNLIPAMIWVWLWRKHEPLGSKFDASSSSILTIH